MLCSVHGYEKGTTVPGELAIIRAATARAMSAARAIGTSAEAFRQMTQLSEVFGQLSEDVSAGRAWLAASMLDSGQVRSLSELGRVFGVSKARADQLVRDGRKRGNPVKDPGTDTEPAVIAIAIIVHPDRHSVLVEHRRDGAPPWTFPAAEILHGESPAAALKRRVPEETGLTIDVDHVIGSRIHPRTGRLIRYLACHLRYPETAQAARSQEDDQDADRVEWMTPEYTRETMADMFGPVRTMLDGLDG